MEFNWKPLLAVFVVGASLYVIVTASDIPEGNLLGEQYDTKTNSRTDDKAEKNQKTSVTQETSDQLGYKVDAPDVKVYTDERKKSEEIFVRSKRAVNQNFTENVNKSTGTGTNTGDVEKSKEDELMKTRSATARLMAHLRNLPVSQEKTVPVIYTQKGEIKVVINASIKLITIFEVNDVRQSIKSGLYITFSWRDQALAWNRSLYENVESVAISPNSIWTPPIFVPNSGKVEDLLEKVKYLELNHTGQVAAHIPILLETSCSMNLSLYPYDEQTCSVKMLSILPRFEWVLEGDAMDKRLSTSLALNSEWDLLKVSTKLFLDSEDNMFPEIEIKLRRKTRFYSVCLILPMVVTSYMNTLVFLVPLQSGEKISFLISLFVSTSVFNSFFSTTMPRGLDETPVSMKLLVGVIVESLLVLLATLLVLKLFHSEQEASAVSNSTEEKALKHSDTCDDDNLTKEAEPNNYNPSHRKEPHPQSLQDPPQSRGVATAWMSPGPSSVTPRDHAVRASRATRFCGLRELTAGQLDRILFVIFLAANSIFLLALLQQVW